MTSIATAPERTVHEALDERQHIRAKIPAVVVIDGVNVKNLECNVLDVSLGGVCFLHDGTLEVGSLLNASIKIVLPSINLTIDSKVKIVSHRGGEYGAQFVELDAAKRDTLRYIISSYLSGEMVGVNGLFNIMQRENYIKERKQKQKSIRSFKDRAKAVSGTLLFSALGAVALCFFVYKTYMLFFSLSASQAYVDANAYVIKMPETGYVDYIVAPGQKEVKVGEPIAAVSTQLIASASSYNSVIASGGDINQLKELTVETVINSPCDCDIYSDQEVVSGFNYKGNQLLDLLPKNEEFYISASFPLSKLSELNRAGKVELELFGSNDKVLGKIVSSKVNAETKEIILKIKPDSNLTIDDYRQPVAVNLFLDLPFFGKH